MERTEKAERRVDLNKALPFIKNVTGGSWEDVIGDHALYYNYLPSLIKDTKPLQVVELGSAAGASTLMMLSQLPKESHLYAISIPEPEGEFRFITKDYDNLTLVRGSSLDPKSYEGFDPSKTDIWFWDTDHNYKQIRAEYDFLKGWLKPGCLVFVDDINLNEGMKRFWSEVEYDKKDISHWHKYQGTGFGVFKR